MPIGDYSGGSTSSSSNSSSNSGGGGRDTGSDYGQFDRAVSQAANNPPSAPSGGGGGQDHNVERYNVSRPFPPALPHHKQYT